MIHNPLLKRSIFITTLVLLSVVSLFFINGYRLTFQKHVGLEKRGVLVLSGNEKNVTVRINDTFTKTDLPYVSTSLPLGNHTVEILKAGFLTYTTHAYLDEEHANIHNITLEPTPDTHNVQLVNAHTGAQLFVLDSSHVGEYFFHINKLYIYSSFKSLEAKKPDTVVDLVTLPHGTLVHSIDRMNEEFLLVHGDASDYFVSQKDAFITPVHLAPHTSLASSTTDRDDPRALLFTHFQKSLSDLFRMNIITIVLPQNEPQTYVVTDKHILSCEYLLPEHCVEIITLKNPAHHVVYWEKEHTFVFDSSQEKNTLTVIQTRPTEPGYFNLSS